MFHSRYILKAKWVGFFDGLDVWAVKERFLVSASRRNVFFTDGDGEEWEKWRGWDGGIEVQIIFLQ